MSLKSQKENLDATDQVECSNRNQMHENSNVILYMDNKGGMGIFNYLLAIHVPCRISSAASGSSKKGELNGKMAVTVLIYSSRTLMGRSMQTCKSVYGR